MTELTLEDGGGEGLGSLGTELVDDSATLVAGALQSLTDSWDDPSSIESAGRIFDIYASRSNNSKTDGIPFAEAPSAGRTLVAKSTEDLVSVVQYLHEQPDSIGRLKAVNRHRTLLASQVLDGVVVHADAIGADGLKTVADAATELVRRARYGDKPVKKGRRSAQRFLAASVTRDLPTTDAELRDRALSLTRHFRSFYFSGRLAVGLYVGGHGELV